MIARRFGRSLKLGAATAAILVIITGTAGHAAVAAAAAAAHESPTRFLAFSFAAFTAGATVAVFILLSVFRSRKPRWEGGDYPRQARRPVSRPESWEQEPPPRGRNTRWGAR